MKKRQWPRHEPRRNLAFYGGEGEGHNGQRAKGKNRKSQKEFQLTEHG